jgi:predicted ester cyclase
MSSSLSADQRKALVRHYLETSWNTPQSDESSHMPEHKAALDDSEQETPSSEDTAISHGSLARIYLGAESLYMPMEEARKVMRASFPDLRFTISDLVVEGEKVAVRWLMQGTDLGGVEQHPPTGRSMRLTGITMMRIEGQRIVEEWNEVDIAGMLRQLGFVFVQQPPKITMRRPGPQRPSQS